MRYNRVHHRLLLGALVLVAVYLITNVGFYVVRSYVAYRAELRSVAQEMAGRVRDNYDDLLESTIRSMVVATDTDGVFRDSLLEYDGSYAHRVALLNGLQQIQSAVTPVESAYALVAPTGEVFSLETGAFYEDARFYDRDAAELMRGARGVAVYQDRVVTHYGSTRSYTSVVLEVRSPVAHASVIVNLRRELLERELMGAVPGAGDDTLSIVEEEGIDDAADDEQASVLSQAIRAVSRSESFGRAFVLDLGSADISQAIRATASFAGISLLAAALVFAGFAFLLTRSLRPLDQLLARVKSSEAGERGADIGDLEDYLTGLMTDNEWLQGEYERLLPERRKEFLRDLFTGRVTDPDRFDEQLAFNNVTAPETGVVAACLLVDVQDLSEQRRLEATALVDRLLEDRVAERENGFHVLISRNLYGLAIPAPEDRTISSLERPFFALLSDAPELIRRRMFVGVGQPTRRVRDLVESYDQAQEALEYRRTLGRQVICAASLIALRNRRYRYPYEKERLLIERLQSGDQEASLGVLNEILDQIVADRLGDREIEYVRLQLIHALNRYLYEHEIAEDEQESLYRRYDTTHANTIEEVRTILSDIVTRTIRAQHEHRTASRRELVAGFVEHIRTNCTAPSYQLLDLEEEFGLNRYYIGQLIHEHTGKHFNDHLNEARISRATDIFRTEPRVPIKDVAARVGYAYAYYFTRQFKRIHGVTPKVFQESLIDIPAAE